MPSSSLVALISMIFLVAVAENDPKHKTWNSLPPLIAFIGTAVNAAQSHPSQLWTALETVVTASIAVATQNSLILILTVASLFAAHNTSAPVFAAVTLATLTLQYALLSDSFPLLARTLATPASLVERLLAQLSQLASGSKTRILNSITPAAVPDSDPNNSRSDPTIFFVT